MAYNLLEKTNLRYGKKKPPDSFVYKSAKEYF